MDLEQVICSVLHHDNATRRAAEQAFNQIKAEHPELLMAQLMRLLSSSSDDLVRTSCAVLARRQVVALYSRLGSECRAATKASLLRSVEAEPRADVRRKVCDAIGELACALFPEDCWPELVDGFLLRDDGAGAQPDSLLSRLSILTAVAGSIIVPAPEDDEPSAADLARTASVQERVGVLVHAALQPAQPVAIRLEAIRVLEEVVVVATEASSHDAKTAAQLRSFGERVRGLAPAMMATVEELLTAVARENADEANSLDAMERLVNIATASPRYFLGQAAPLINAMFSVGAVDSGLPSCARVMAVEVILSLCEAAPKMVASEMGGAAVAERAWPLLGGMMRLGFRLADAHAWAAAAAISTTGGEDDDEEGELEIAVAREAAHRLSDALGGLAVVPSLLAMVEASAAAAANDDGGALHGALVLVAWAAGNCTEELRAHVPQLFVLIEHAAAHAHARVRWAAAEAVMHLCEAFPLLLADARALGPAATRSVLAALNDAELAVCRHGADALIALCEAVASSAEESAAVGDDVPLLGAAAAPLLQGLVRLLAPQVPTPAQDVAVEAIGSLARAARGDAIVSHTPELLASLRARIGALTSAQHVSSRGKAIEAAGAVVAVSLGSAVTDGYALLDSLAQALAALPAGADEPELVKAVHGAWVEIAKVVGAKFDERLTGALLPRLLAAAAIEIEVRVTDLTEEEAAEHEEREEREEREGGADDDDDEGDAAGWSSKVIKAPAGKWIRVAVNGHTIAAKTSALTTLHMLADALGVGFAPHVSAFMAILTTDCHGCAPGGGLLTYRFEEAIRRDAAYASYELCKCAALALRAGAASSAADVRSLFESTLHRLISALRTEASTSVAVALAMAIKELLVQARLSAGCGLAFPPAQITAAVIDACKARVRKAPAFKLLAAGAAGTGKAADDAKAQRLISAAAAAAAAAGANGAMASTAHEGADDEDEAAEEEEVEQLEMILEVCHALLAWFGVDAVGHMDGGLVLPFLVNLVSTPPLAQGGTSAHEALRCFGIGIVDDLLELTVTPPEHVGSSPQPAGAGAAAPTAPLTATHPAQKYVVAALAPMAAGAAGLNVGVAQASFHGLGLAAERAGKLLTKQATAHAVSLAVGWLHAPDAFTLRTSGVCAAATTMLARALAHRTRFVDAAAVLPTFLSALGRVHDADDLSISLRQLCVLGESEAGAELLHGAITSNPALATSALVALARALACTETAEDAPLAARFSALVRRVASATPAEALKASASALAPPQQLAIQLAISASS